MISVIVPTYKRPYCLPKVYEEIHEVMIENGYSYEIIVVDDGSFDETERIIRNLCTKDPAVKGMILEQNYGQQNATLAGLRLAQFDYVVTIDDDLQHDAQSIPALIHGLEAGYDVVYGVSYAGNHALFRKIGTHLKEWIFYTLCNKPKEIRLTSYRAMNRKTVDYIIKDPIDQVYISARILKKTNNIGNVAIPSKTDMNQPHPSGYKLNKLIGLIWAVIKNYSNLPLIKKLRRTGTQYSIKEIIP